jgi:hypothetical protein
MSLRFAATLLGLVLFIAGHQGQAAITLAPPPGTPVWRDVTTNTVRLSGPDVFSAATAITQTTYGATHHEDRPHAVTLVRADRQADAMLAASRITHFPVNSPVLYVEADRIPPVTLAELRRLGPDGNEYDNNVQIYLVGPIAPSVEQQIRERLGYRTRSFRIADPVALSEALDTWAAAVHADHPDEVAIVQLDRLDTGLPAVAWNAHMGHGLFFVRGGTVPPETRRALQRRYRQDAFIYLLGDETVIPPEAERALSAFGHVQRVTGNTPEAISLRFAEFQDRGLNQGYWIGFWTREFGWGVTEPGHNFTFANPADWQQAVTGSVLSHMGKHGPMILIGPNGPSAATAAFLSRIRPPLSAPGDQLSNHGWILGDRTRISWPAQADIDLLLDQSAAL